LGERQGSNVCHLIILIIAILATQIMGIVIIATLPTTDTGYTDITDTVRVMGTSIPIIATMLHTIEFLIVIMYIMQVAYREERI
jgi:uncharacterized membrane protein